MTTLLGTLVVDDPCARCGGTHIWLMHYSSWRYNRFVCVCEKCGNSLVVEPKRVLLAKAGAYRRSWISGRRYGHRV